MGVAVGVGGGGGAVGDAVGVRRMGDRVAVAVAVGVAVGVVVGDGVGEIARWAAPRLKSSARSNSVCAQVVVARCLASASACWCARTAFSNRARSRAWASGS